MTILYLDLSMGAAGDMLSAAVSGLTEDPKALEQALNTCGIAHTTARFTEAEQCGVRGRAFDVCVDGHEEEPCPDRHKHHHKHHHGHKHHKHDHHHADLSDVRAQIEALTLPQAVKADVYAVYKLLAEAESRAHGVPVSKIHFHEVGEKDALMDIAAFCLCIHQIKPDKIVASPVTTGYGSVECAHGVLPVPAPATAYLLEGIPSAAGDIASELCTPTGAALVNYFVQEYSRQPVMRVEKIGYGIGHKSFSRVNCVRAMLGEAFSEQRPQENAAPGERAVLLECNLDDITGEQVAYACEKLRGAGALDVTTAPLFMKKDRPGLLLSVLCRPEETDTFLKLLFSETTTLGVRKQTVERTVLARSSSTFKSSLGPVRVKKSEGYGAVRVKIEYEDLRRVARENHIPLEQARRQIEAELG